MQIEQRRDALLQMRVNEAERKAIYEAADAANLTASEYFRRAALGRRIDLMPSPGDWKAAMILSQCVGLVKQVYKGEIADRELTWQTLTRIKEAIKRLRLGDRAEKAEEFRPSGEARKIIIQISLLKGERDEIAAAARRHGQGVSEYVRSAAIRRRPPRRKARLGEADLERIRECGRGLKALCLGEGSVDALKEMLKLAKELAE